jgi:predicted TIM-barrel fold metal-dependent hydrolase
MLQDDVQLISVDDHVIEHARVWQDRLPERFKADGPQVHRDDKGNDMWHFAGTKFANIGLNAVAGKRREDFNMDPTRFEDMIPGCYDPAARVRDLDTDGIQAQLCFPSFGGFAGTKFAEAKDHNLGLACVRAYNDWMLEEWCATAPDRFIPMVMVPFWDPNASAREVERTAAMGAKAVTFPENPPALGMPSFHTDHWDPLWAAVQDAQMPLCMHFGTGGAPPIQPGAPFAVAIALMGMNSQSTAVEMMFSPMFRKFPGLRVALSEGGIGWMPYVLERCDYTWERHRHYQHLALDVPPSQVFRDHIFGCFISDETGLEVLDRIGVDQVMWECDYPHSDSNWPHARKVLAEQVRHLPDDVCRRIAEDNARRLFHFDGGRG